MSSNIGPEAKAKYQKYLDAETLEEKIKRLEEFISAVPKHKGTEKIVALNKTRLVKLKKELEGKKQRQKRLGSQVSPFSIKSEGIQVVLVSDYHTPGIGKTSILNYLTGAKQEQIGKFTVEPQIGIYKFKNINYQIVDMPAIMKDASKGVAHGREILSAIRSANLVCFCIDLSRSVEKQMKLLINEFEEANIRINKNPPPIDIKKTGANKIQVLYLTDASKKCQNLDEDIKSLVRESGMQNAIVKVFGEINIDDLLDALNPSIVYIKVMILATKGDLPETEKQFKILKRKFSEQFPLILGVSAIKGKGFEKFGQKILDFLGFIKIFTKSGIKVAETPIIMEKGASVKDVALKIHKNFYEFFKYAVIHRKGTRMKKKRVGLDYLVKNEDIIEIYTTI